jgi:predicted transcriptional regulator
MARRLIPAQKTRIRKLHSEGWSQRKIARDIGCSQPVVHYWINTDWKRCSNCGGALRSDSVYGLCHVKVQCRKLANAAVDREADWITCLFRGI